MGSVYNNKEFALILTRHRLWGSILTPYIIQKASGSSYYKLVECLSPFPNNETLGFITSEEREIVKLINDYGERILFKHFSKHKNLKEFLEKTDTEKIEKFIRPYIERRIYKCLSIIRNENINVYYQKTRIGTLHPEDRLTIDEDPSSPVFTFVRDDEKTTYRLNLEITGNLIAMNSGNVEILCMSPCVIREDHRILLVSSVDGYKLKPFLLRDSINIPKQTELKYFKGFVLNAVNNFKVQGSGFEIIETEPVKKAVLEIEIGIKGNPVIILQYFYEGKKIFSNHADEYITFFEKEGDKYIFRKFKRNFIWEKSCRDILGELGYFSEDEICFFPFSDTNTPQIELFDLIEAINKNYDEIVDAGFVLSSRLNQKFNFKQVDIEISSSLENDWFDLKAKVRIGEWEFPFTSFRKNILNGIREYLLPDGSLAILPAHWFSKFRNIFELGKCSDKLLKIHKQHFSLLPEMFTKESKPGLEKLEKLLSHKEIPSVIQPAGLKCDMREYQTVGLNWLVFLQTSGLGGCLADDMGLGKTIQTLALLQHNKENIHSTKVSVEKNELSLFAQPEPPLTSLLIVPASLVYNWENEIKRFVPEMKAHSHVGHQRTRSTAYFNNFDIIISSYHTVRQDVELISEFPFHYIILDESQVIKNPASMLYKTVTRLNSAFKLVLSGTPVENSLTDLWTQLNFVNPGLLGDLTFFRREFAKPIEKLGDDEKETKLKKIISPFILRRTKEMVAQDLPPVTEQMVFCDMTEEQQKLYEIEKSSVRNTILKNVASNGLEKSSFIVLQGLLKLRQISNHPAMGYDDYTFSSGKYETVLQDIQSVLSEGHKILVFSSFVKHLDLFARELSRLRIEYAMLTGASTNKEKIVNSFQEDNKQNIFLISLKAGGVGLNLTAADYVFILDPWWNPASEMQALSRAHRIGQNKNVFVYRYITSNSIEEKIIRLQEKKSKLAESFISSNNPLKELDIQLILDIIG